MPNDPALIAEVRAWLAKAQSDLAMARLALGATKPLYDQSVYHAQQTAEKSMKALLSWHQKVFRKTHNLVELGEACSGVEPTFEEQARRAAVLTDYAWRYRYPGDPDMPSQAEANSAVTVAEAVYASVVSRLPAEARP